MSTPEFKIKIGQQSVDGEYGLPGWQTEPAGQDPNFIPDPLVLETVGLMNRWLGFWCRIDDSEIRRKEALLEPHTLEVLGTHLWKLILENEVGEALRAHIPAEGDPPIRLSIEFDDGADPTLKGLPWEFLFEPVHEWFLATKTELLLTRYVSPQNRPARVRQLGDREVVRALLIAALPDDEKFDTERRKLGKLRTALKDVKYLDVPEPVDVWDPNGITENLKNTEYHIVHVVGICRGTPGHAQIYLGGGDDGFQDPAMFVNTLIANRARPRLIILQLCDYVDGDASENFERLAPELIKNEVPAVLALQYATKQADQVGLGKQFYQSLIDGEPIGAAVQASRHRLRTERPPHRFGMPVLYLQEDGPLCPRRSLTHVTTIPTESPSATSIQGALVDIVLGLKDLEEERRDEFLDWVIQMDDQISRAQAKEKIMDRMRNPRLDGTSRQACRDMLKSLARMETGNGRV